MGFILHPRKVCQRRNLGIHDCVVSVVVSESLMQPVCSATALDFYRFSNELYILTAEMKVVKSSPDKREFIIVQNITMSFSQVVFEVDKTTYDQCGLCFTVKTLFSVM